MLKTRVHRRDPAGDEFSHADTAEHGWLGALRHWGRRSGGKIAAALLLLGGAGAIIFNAVILQPSRHPAPLFAVVDAARAVQDKPVVPPRNALVPATAHVPAPPRREPERLAEERVPERASVRAQPRVDRAPADRTPEKADRPVEKAERAPSRPAIVTASIPARPPAKAAQADPLGELIRGGIVPPAAIPSEPDTRLLNIQKNLVRLGYSTGRPDGLMGPGTRAAIEKFERARKWPVTGEVSPQLARELGAVSARRD